MSFHAVKLANQPVPGYGARVVDALKGAGRWAFDEHPLPMLTPLNGAGRPNTVPSFTPNLFERYVLRQDAHGAHTPVQFGANGPHVPFQVGYGTGALNKLKTLGHSVGEFVREGTLGSPLAFHRTLKERGLGGMVRDFYLPRGAGMLGTGIATGIALATPAFDLYKAVRSGPEQRGSNIGGAIAGAAVAPLTARLGIPGGLLIQQPVQRFGRWVGHHFDRKPLEGPIAQAAQVSAPLTSQPPLNLPSIPQEVA